MSLALPLPDSKTAHIPCDVIHVGMPKCGSTFLQHIGFAQHPHINLIWEPGHKLFFELRDNVDAAHFDIDDYASRLRTHVLSRIESSTPESRTVFSFEGFCGPQTTNRNDKLLAKTLRQLVGHTKVIFIVREQYSLLYSIWAQYIKEGGTLSCRDFFGSENSPAQPHNSDENIFRRVQYAGYVETLMELFGKENVGVFLFEDFIADYQNFMKSMYRFVGVDEELIPQNTILWRGPNRYNAGILRWLNSCSTTKHRTGLLPYDFYIWYRQRFEKHIFPSRRLNPSARHDIQKFLDRDQQEAIGQSNQCLSGILNRNLEDLGYALS